MSTDLVPQAGGGAIYSKGRPPGFKNPNAGRPTDLTPELATQIAKTISEGHYAQVAVAEAGINEQTFYAWLKRGDDPNEQNAIYREFTKMVLQASAEPEKKALSALEAKWNDDWKSAAWWLERRFPKRWGRQQRIEISTAPDNDMGWE